MNDVKMAFATIDKNGDGLINKDELIEGNVFNLQAGPFILL